MTMRTTRAGLLLMSMVVSPGLLRAQPADARSPWNFTAAVGAGVADVPRSTAPRYFDSSQLTARVGVQRTLGADLYGGVSLLGTLATEGGDCTLGACAPQFRHHALSATLSYVRGNIVRRWMPIPTLGAGIARLENWDTPASNTMLLNAAVDLPLLVRPRTALLLGWESSLLPNAPGDRILVNTLVLTLRTVPLAGAGR